MQTTLLASITVIPPQDSTQYGHFWSLATDSSKHLSDGDMLSKVPQGTYFFTVYHKSLSGCASSKTISIVPVPSLNPLIISAKRVDAEGGLIEQYNLSNKTIELCYADTSTGHAIVLSTPFQDFAKYKWYQKNSIVSNKSSLTVSLKQSATYLLKVSIEVNTPSGLMKCSQLLDSITIKFKLRPNISIIKGPNTIVCPDTFMVTATPGATYYKWQLKQSGIVQEGITTNPSFVFDFNKIQNGNFSYIVIGFNGCGDSAFFNRSAILNRVKASLLPTDTLFCKQDSIDITGDAIVVGGINQMIWSLKNRFRYISPFQIRMLAMEDDTISIITTSKTFLSTTSSRLCVDTAKLAFKIRDCDSEDEQDETAKNVKLLWLKQLGGTANEEGNHIVADKEGNVYVSGYFSGTVDFDPSDNVYELSTSTFNNIFILKLDRNGNFVWAKQISADYVTHTSLSIDSKNNLLLTGHFEFSVDFDPSTMVNTLTSTGGDNIFVLKLDDNGNFVWVNKIEGTKPDLGNWLAVDDKNNILVIGSYEGTASFTIGSSVVSLTSTKHVSFLLKVSEQGNLVWVKEIPLTLIVDTDKEGNIYLTNTFYQSTDLDPGLLVNDVTPSQNGDVFVIKLDSEGQFNWAKHWPGKVNTLAVDDNGNVHTAGFFLGKVDFDPNLDDFYMYASNYQNSFIHKLDTDGNFQWAKEIVGNFYDTPNITSLAIDSLQNVLITGSLYSHSDFNPGGNVFEISSIGSSDIFIQKLNIDAKFVWAKGMGGMDNDSPCSIFAGKDGSFYVSGFYTKDFNTSRSSTAFGKEDIFVIKFGLDVPTSLEENINSSNTSVILYPNPTTGQINIQLPPNTQNVELRVYSITGAQLKTQPVYNTKEPIDLSLPLGTYLYSLWQNGARMAGGVLLVR